MVTNWTISGGTKKNSNNLYHVTAEGAEYAERNMRGTMGNLLNSYDQNKGFQDEPVKKRLTNSDAEFIAKRNQQGTMSNIIHTQNEKAIRSSPQPAQGIPRLKTSDALEIQNKSLNGSMTEILNVKQNQVKGPASQMNTKQVRATTADAKSNVQHGQVGTIGALVLNPGAKNICSEREHYGAKQRRAADAANVAPAERVRTDTAGRIAIHGKQGTYGILHGNSITPDNTKCKRFSEGVKQGFVASQQMPRPRTRNEAADNNLNHGNVGTLGVLLQGKPGNVNSARNKYNEGVTRSLDASTIKPAPRVRPEAAEIANKHSGFVRNLIVDVSNKPKPVKKSASIDQLNYNRMKKKEKEGQKKMEKSEDKKLWKNAKYERTESRLKQWMDSTYGATNRPGSAGQKRPATANKKGGLKKSASDSCLKRNFIAENAKKARDAPVRVNPMKLHDKAESAKRKEDAKSYQRGVVPDYLQTRVAKWKAEEQERIANMPDPSVPEGHVVMDSKEKKETLGILVKSRDRLVEQLQNLPLRNDTLRLHNTRTQLQSKLGEIDDAIKIFSRPRVFIKQD